MGQTYEFHFAKQSRSCKIDYQSVIHPYDRCKLNSSSGLKMVVITCIYIISLSNFILSATASSHSFINNHINNIGAEGDPFFEDYLPSSSSTVNNNNNAGISLCLPNYEVSEGSIIRTKDSIELGARFLNESDLGTNGRDECLRLCCQTPHCNVAVFQDKNSGSCYMFDCGSPEEFRCKFTSQIHYMSAILRRKEVVQVPQNMPQHTSHSIIHNGNGNNQHEAELSQLRSQVGESDKSNANTNSGISLSDNNNLNNGNSKETSTSAPASLGILDSNSRHSRCSRWQFECKTTGECIAIYNACDGIVQCEDGSDEGPELHCPSVLGPVSNIHVDKGQLPKNQQSASMNGGALFPEKSLNNADNNHINLQQPSLAQAQPDYSGQANKQQVVVNEKNEHIFNHKDAGIMEQNYGGQLQQQMKHNNNPFWKPQPFDYNNGEQLPSSGFGQPYPQNPQQLPNNVLYGNVLSNNNNYPGGPNYPSYAPRFPGQQQPSIPESLPPGYNTNTQVQTQMQQQQYYGNNLNSLNNPNNLAIGAIEKPKGQQQSQNPIFIPPPSRFGIPSSGSDSSRNAQGSILSALPATTIGPTLDSKLKSMTISPPHQDAKLNGKTDASKTLLTSLNGVDENKFDSESKLEDEILRNLKNQPYSIETAAVHLEELTPHKAGPGAFLLFILGLGMSIVMAVVVGCRLRRVGIGTRRRRKNRLDPDYLVDGMYL